MDITEKIWWIALKKESANESAGPYSYLDLERDEKLTPDTYVWKEGWPSWKKAHEVDELKHLFDKSEPLVEDLGQEGVEDLTPVSETVADSSIPPWIFFWIIAIIL